MITFEMSIATVHFIQHLFVGLDKTNSQRKGPPICFDLSSDFDCHSNLIRKFSDFFKFTFLFKIDFD